MTGRRTTSSSSSLDELALDSSDSSLSCCCLVTCKIGLTGSGLYKDLTVGEGADSCKTSFTTSVLVPALLVTHRSGEGVDVPVEC